MMVCLLCVMFEYGLVCVWVYVVHKLLCVFVYVFDGMIVYLVLHHVVCVHDHVSAIVNHFSSNMSVSVLIAAYVAI